MENVLHQVLTLDAREILEGAGRISKKVADTYALTEYQKFRPIQDAAYVCQLPAPEGAGLLL